ncbi:MAG: hypothetical protein K2L11_10535 [Muribaculaceae bacterium]|nr:hypothetical protein [Muribaculaceae bacterium]
MKKILSFLAITCAMAVQAQDEYTPLKQSEFCFDKEAFHELRCSVPVYVTYTVNDTITPSVKPIGLEVYVDCVNVRAENNTLFLDFNLPDYMNPPRVNDLQINITGPALTRIEADAKCMLMTSGNQTLESPIGVFASDQANIVISDRISAPKITVYANSAVAQFSTVDTPLMSILANNLSIVDIYSPESSGISHVNKLEIFAKGYSTVLVSDTKYDSLVENKDEGSKITFQ